MQYVTLDEDGVMQHDPVTQAKEELKATMALPENERLNSLVTNPKTFLGEMLKTSYLHIKEEVGNYQYTWLQALMAIAFFGYTTKYFVLILSSIPMAKMILTDNGFYIFPYQQPLSWFKYIVSYVVINLVMIVTVPKIMNYFYPVRKEDKWLPLKAINYFQANNRLVHVSNGCFVHIKQHNIDAIPSNLKRMIDGSKQNEQNVFVQDIEWYVLTDNAAIKLSSTTEVRNIYNKI